MIKFISLLLILIASISALSPCQPFGLRIYYGDVLIDTTSPDRFAVYFNTQQPCKDSFVNIVSSNGFQRLTCENVQATTSAYANFYSAYIHQCSFSNIPFEETFSYIAFGWASDQQSYSTAHKFGWVDVLLADPTSKQAEMKVIAFADWGVIQSTDLMTPIVSDLRKIIKNQRINAVVIAGDIAYDLDSKNGTIYEGFLGYIEEFTSKIPFILAPGNHQRKKIDAALLFNKTFKTYGVDTKLASGLSFGSIFFLPFDPFNPIYGKPQTISSLQALKAQLIKGSNSGRFIIPFSHYPLICSAQSQQCLNQFATLHDYLDAMIDAGTSLFIGAHTHSYQRNYPYFKDHSFLSMQSPYQGSAGYLVSIVEGVAGNQVSITESMPQKMDYTARYTVGQTGFGVIKASKSQVSYSHYSTDQGFMDSILFTRKVKGTESLITKLKNIRINDD